MTTEETNRREFEEWITAMPYERDITRRPNDFEKYAFPNTYVDYQVDLAWEAWQAARKQVTEQRDAASAEFYRYHGLWDRATKQLETVMYQRDRLAETNNRVIELLKDGLQTDGSHHKQWYLNEVLKLINADIAKDVEMHWTHDRGIAP